MFFLDNQTTIGLDIGTTAIKFAELKRKGNKIELVNYGILEKQGYLERSNDAIQTNTLKLLEERTAALIKTLLDKANCRSRNVVMSLPNFSAFVSTIDLPKMPIKEIAKVISLQASQYVPVSLQDMSLDWQIVEENTEKIQVLLMAIPKEVVGRYVRISDLMKLNLKSLEIESISAVRALEKNNKGIFMIVDLGGKNTSFNIIDNGKLRFSRNIDISGGDLTQVIATGMGINSLRAEELKRLFGLKKEETQLKNLMKPLLGAIRLEIEKNINHYYQKTSRKVEKIVLIGSGANLLGLTEYYQEGLKIPVEKGDPFKDNLIEHSAELNPVIKEISSSLVIACGLALREMI